MRLGWRRCTHKRQRDGTSALRIAEAGKACGQTVDFEESTGARIKVTEANALISAPVPRGSDCGAHLKNPSHALFANPFFFVLCGAVAYFLRPPGVVALVYLGLSVLTFVVYAADKSAVRRSASRTPESTLHALVRFGGWPEALLAQRLPQHKSSKTPFRAIFWISVVLNVIGFSVLCSPAVRRMLRAS